MSKEQLAEDFLNNEYSFEYKHLTKDEYQKEVKGIKEAFIAGYEAAEPKWISTKEKLPDLTDPLIGGSNEVLIPNYSATVLGYNSKIGVFKAKLTRAGWSEISTISIGVGSPTHWMPLPKNE